jgi:hypothetical protein
MRRTFAILPLFVALACTSEGPEPSVELGADRSPVWSKPPHVEHLSTATDTATEAGIAGTVGRIDRWDGVEWKVRCSGTLVERNKLLTAAHCLFDDAGNRIDPSLLRVHFAQDRRHHPPPHQYESYRIPVRNHVSLRETRPWDHDDLGIIELAEDVPEDVVQNLAPLFTENIVRAAFGNGAYLHARAIQVGYGYGNSDPVSELGDGWDVDFPAGIRRWGYVERLRVANQRLEAPAPFDLSISVMDNGDSGGPLFMFDGREWTVVGVVHSSDPGNFQSWVTTGIIGDLDNGYWILQTLGWQRDGDEHDDAQDNCPASFCREHDLPMDRCNNPGQEDLDGDGIGDSCDLCPPDRCRWLDSINSTVARRFSCYNPAQLDSDGDQLGDECDLCVTVPDNYTYRIDTDGDLVGDECENGCGDVYSPFPECSNDRECDRAGGRCVVGRCIAQRDGDNDGAPDACDACPDDTSIINRNSNRYAEDGAGVERLCDLNDPVPLFRLEPQEQNRFGDDNIYLKGDPYFPWGHGVHSAFTSRVTMRSCNCRVKGSELDEAACVARAECRAHLAQNGGGEWKDLTFGDGVRTFQGDTAPVLTFRPGLQGTETWFYWDYRADGYSGHPWALVASVPLDHQGISWRDHSPIRPVARVFGEPSYYLPEIEIPVSGCQGPPCNIWVRTPWEDLGYPAQRLREEFVDPRILVFQDEMAGILVDPSVGGPKVEISDRLREVLQRGKEFVFVNPTELTSRLGSTASRVQGAFVPVWGAEVTEPVLLVRGEKGGFDLDRDPTFNGAGKTYSELAGVWAPEGGALALSVGENKLYVVGGLFAGEELGLVRRFDLTSRTWEILHIEGAVPSGQVLGAAWEPVGKVLFALDVRDGKARLTRYDLAERKAVTVLETYYSGEFADAGLVALGDGTLVLWRSGHLTYSAWRLDREGAILGRMDRAGEVLQGPVAGEYDLEALVWRDIPVYERWSAESFDVTTGGIDL